MKKKYYTESNLKQIFDLNDRYLSRYEAEGILHPLDIAEEEDRCFTYEDVRRLEAMLKLREAGVDISTAKAFLNDSDAINNEIKRLQEEREELSNRIARLDFFRADDKAFIIRPLVVKACHCISERVNVSVAENGYCTDTRHQILSLGEDLFRSIYEQGGHISRDIPSYYSFDPYRFRNNNHSCLRTYVLTEPMENSYYCEETPAIYTYVKGSFDHLPEAYEALLKCVELKGLRICGKVNQWVVSGEDDDKGVVGVFLPVESTEGMGKVIIMRR